jgi:hypothetical protein
MQTASIAAQISDVQAKKLKLQQPKQFSLKVDKFTVLNLDSSDPSTDDKAATVDKGSTVDKVDKASTVDKVDKVDKGMKKLILENPSCGFGSDMQDDPIAKANLMRIQVNSNLTDQIKETDVKKNKL